MLVNGVWTKDWDPVQATDEKADLFVKLRHFEIGSRRLAKQGQPALAVSKPKPIAIICMWL